MGSLRGVGKQMLPFLLLLTSVNAQFIPGDGDWRRAPFLEGDFANDGQDDYLDYMEQEQLGDTAPNLNIRGDGNAIQSESANNPCFIDPTGCYLELQRLRRADYMQPSLAADPCLLDPTGCYTGSLEQGSGKGTKKPGLISKPGGARPTLPPRNKQATGARTTLPPRNKQATATEKPLGTCKGCWPGPSPVGRIKFPEQGFATKKPGLISKPGGARTTLAPLGWKIAGRFETAQKPGLISKPGTRTTTPRPLRPPRVTGRPSLKRVL